ncbi:MAG: site-specific integrase [Beijerinckiaceae bacterium]|nr:MAG: site-specific integrase [Beijerinckiaceae bacterium]
MAKTLTAAAVAKLKPEKVRREIPDGACQGLYLVIQPSGVKSFAYRFRQPKRTAAKLGKPAKITLGRVDIFGTEVADPAIGGPLTLAAARKLATELSHRRARGEDIIASRRQEKDERAAQNGKTFGGAVFDFITQYAKPNTRRWQEQARLLGIREAVDGTLEMIPKGLAERWQDTPLATISVDDVFGVVDEAREKGVPGLERRAKGSSESRALAMRAALSVMFGWAVDRRRISVNPVIAVARPTAAKARDRVLADAEIKNFWKSSGDEWPQVTAVLRLLLLTGQRLNEVSEITRGELSADFSLWTIPGSRTKNGREHLVPLPPLAQQIVKQFVPDSAGLSDADKNAFVFSMDGEHAPAIGSKIKARLDAAMNAPAWRFHDLRRTAVTGMNEIGIQPDVVELCVNHVSGHKAGVAGTYDRSKKLAERRAAFERWASHVAGVVSDSDRKENNVIPIGEAR